jgi:alpha-mannosidase
VPVVTVEEVNLLEDSGPRIAVSDNSVRLDFKPFEIKTLLIEFLTTDINIQRS